MYGIMYAHGLLGTSCPARYESTFDDVAIIFRDTSFELFMACEYHLLQVTHLTQVQLGVYDACYVSWMDAQPKNILIRNSRYNAVIGRTS